MPCALSERRCSNKSEVRESMALSPRGHRGLKATEWSRKDKVRFLGSRMNCLGQNDRLRNREFVEEPAQGSGWMRAVCGGFVSQFGDYGEEEMSLSEGRMIVNTCRFFTGCWSLCNTQFRVI